MVLESPIAEFSKMVSKGGSKRTVVPVEGEKNLQAVASREANVPRYTYTEHCANCGRERRKSHRTAEKTPREVASLHVHTQLEPAMGDAKQGEKVQEPTPSHPQMNPPGVV